MVEIFTGNPLLMDLGTDFQNLRSSTLCETSSSPFSNIQRKKR